MKRQQSNKSQIKTAIVVPHTHWDRAWYLPFGRMRVKLARMVDAVVELLQSKPEYTTFCLDGQTILLEDYLELRPQQREILKQLITARRLTVGPWYVLPDEFLVSGESLVRNLLIGTRMAKEFGHCMQVGYQPDSFGHVTQMPQLLNGFGIDNFLFMRGGGDFVDEAQGVFHWDAPGGQGRVLAVYEAGGGYWNLFGWGIKSDRIRFLVDTLDSLIPDPTLALEKVTQRLEEIRAYGFPGNTALLTNGVDHLPAQPQVPELIAACNRQLKGVQLVQGGFEDFIAAVRKVKRPHPAYTGELHEGKHWAILPGVFSSRTYLKQANCRATVALERTAEPLAALGWLLGAEYPAVELGLAWKELLKNHPHDDVCGCSVDAVHEDDMVRARQVTELATGLAQSVLLHLGRKVVNTADGAVMPQAPAMLLLNSLTRPRAGWVHIPSFWVPGELPVQSGGLVAADGTPVPGWWRMTAHEMAEVHAYCPYVPALGWSVLHLTRKRTLLAGVTADRLRMNLENTKLQVHARMDGTLTILHKPSGRTWTGIGFFEDREDAGDSYDYSPLPRSPMPITSLKRERIRWHLERLHGMQPVLRGNLRLRVPAGLTANRKARDSRLVDLDITLTVSLLPDSERVEFLVEFTNTAIDHRLRLAFPTGCDVRTVRAASPFDLVERPVQHPERPDYNQPPLQTRHCDGLVSVADEDGGCAVFTEGLHEYEARQEQGQTTLYITLLRAFGWMARGDLLTRKGCAGHEIPTPDGQALRPHALRLAFRPHAGLEAEPALLAERDEFLTPLAAAAVAQRRHDSSPHAGWLALEPAGLCVTAVKRAEDRQSLVVRCFNPGKEPVQARLGTGFPVAQAWRLRLDETRETALPVMSTRSITTNIPPGQIATIELVQKTDGFTTENYPN